MDLLSEGGSIPVVCPFLIRFGCEGTVFISSLLRGCVMGSQGHRFCWILFGELFVSSLSTGLPVVADAPMVASVK